MDTEQTVVLAGKNNEVAFDPQMIAALQSKFRTRDVRGELLKARLWLLRYPARRPVNVWRFVDNWLKRADAVVAPPPVTVIAWWATDERTVQQGHALGMSARPGESMAQFRERVAERIRNERAA